METFVDLDQGLTRSVQGGGGLVQQQQVGFPDQGPGYRDPLLLAPGELGARLPHQGVQTLRQVLHKLPSIGLLASLKTEIVFKLSYEK